MRSQVLFHRGQGGSAAVKSLVVSIAVVVLGVLSYKFVTAYVDISGMESDLGKVSGSLMIDCVGDPGCEEELIGQIEDVRTMLHPQITLDYSTLDYNGAGNILSVEGRRVVDFKKWKYGWKFLLRVEIFR